MATGVGGRFGDRVVSNFISPTLDQIHLTETDTTLLISFITDSRLDIECDKLGTFDANGKSSCKIAECGSCNLISVKKYSSPSPLRVLFNFLILPVDDGKVSNKRGILDIFINKDQFSLAFYFDSFMKRIEFKAGTFRPGCYSCCSIHFMALNDHRQTIFQTRVHTRGNYKASNLTQASISP